MTVTLDTAYLTPDDAQRQARYVMLPADSVLRGLRLTRPHVSTDPDLRAVCGVSVQRRRGEITVAASDRFTLAAVTDSVEDGLDASEWEFLIPTGEVDRLLDSIEPGTRYIPLGPNGSNQGSVDGYTFPVADTSFPDWRGLIANPGEPVSDVTLDPELLARFAGVLTELEDPPRWRLRSRYAVCVCGGVGPSAFQVLHGIVALHAHDHGDVFDGVELPVSPPHPDGSGLPPRG